MADKYWRKAKQAQISRNCRNKKAYDTEEDARKGAAGFHKFKLHSYVCPECSRFHLTKKEN